jgi:hypothetical protein
LTLISNESTTDSEDEGLEYEEDWLNDLLGYHSENVSSNVLSSPGN